MDPVTAFGLTAGVVQVIDFSFKALSTCREIYRDGSLAEHRHIRDVTQQLRDTTRHLEVSISHIPIPLEKDSKDVMDLSKKCSETASELLKDLKKLQQDPKSSFRQSFGKSLLALRKKQHLAETQDKLDKYREVLNTRILVKLDSRALQHFETYNTLDQGIKDLATGLSEGRNTFERLLADQTTVIKEHLDCRFDNKANEEAILKTQQQFRDSLFYPEIFARQEDIARSHDGTCRWIFGPPIEDEAGSTTAEFRRRVYHELADSSRQQPWSDFKEWLIGDSKDPYWLSGKPGSGKSTLMKYITTEFNRHCRADETLFAWSNAVICSFFFSNIGTSLQKNYVGLLRSLLFQIAGQRPEMIQAMGYQSNPTGSPASQIETHSSFPVYTWTEQRLYDTLTKLIQMKPPTLRVCIFIDGLDEFVGDEDRLIETIHVLSQASNTKVCASSRPEQIFRQGFGASPQLRLQDLNNPDIRKATIERLLPTLRANVPCSEHKLDYLVHAVIAKSQGIFLWVDLMIKDLKNGARNADSIEELRERLDRTPDTIDGLYKHMLGRVDKTYLRDAARYLHHLFLFQQDDWLETMPPTLLGFACIEDHDINHQMIKDPCKVQLSKIQELCRRVETRILTRCGGLVEIVEHGLRYLPYLRFRSNVLRPLVKQGEECISCFFREVKFIHRSAADFLRNHRPFKESDWRLTGALSAVRAQIAVVRLTPWLLSQPRSSSRGPIAVDYFFLGDLMGASMPRNGFSSATRDAAIVVVNEVYDVLCYLNSKLNDPYWTISKSYVYLLMCDVPDFVTYFQDIEDDMHPFKCRLGFAAYFGRYDYTARYLASKDFSQVDIEFVLNCAILGFELPSYSHGPSSTVRGLLKILLEYIPLSKDLNMMRSRSGLKTMSKWDAFVSTFASIAEEIATTEMLSRTQDLIKLWKDVIVLFFIQNPGADPNITAIYTMCVACGPNGEELSMLYEESILAQIEHLVSRLSDAALESMKEIEDILGNHGGVHSRRVLHVGYEHQQNISLTDDEGRRLLSALTLELLESFSSTTYVTTTSATPVQPDLVLAARIVADVEKWAQSVDY